MTLYLSALTVKETLYRTCNSIGKHWGFSGTLHNQLDLLTSTWSLANLLGRLGVIGETISFDFQYFNRTFFNFYFYELKEIFLLSPLCPKNLVRVKKVWLSRFLLIHLFQTYQFSRIALGNHALTYIYIYIYIYI